MSTFFNTSIVIPCYNEQKEISKKQLDKMTLTQSNYKTSIFETK
jgi:cellulose synthase/poly-beta-1,6-N-acetylglucosamine synthase-like glycosyltransferase